MTIVYIIVFLILLSAVVGSLSAAPWVPTKGKDVGRMIDLANIKSGDKVYDLGCGDGRLVFASTKGGAKAVGVEIFVLPYLYAKIRSFFVPGSKIKYGNFFRQDITDADVVFIFLMEKSYHKILDKFNKELKPGARVVIYCWPIKEWEDKLIARDKPREIDLPIYSYKV